MADTDRGMTITKTVSVSRGRPSRLLDLLAGQDDLADACGVAARDASKARGHFGWMLNRVANRKERVIIRRRGKAVAVIVPIEDLALIEKMEDQREVEAARKALAEAGEIPYGEVHRKLGL